MSPPFLGRSSLLLSAAAPPAADGVFGLEKVWPIHLQFSAEEYKALQPLVSFGFPGPSSLALANFRFMGNPQQLMNLSLRQSYPGPNESVQ